MVPWRCGHETSTLKQRYIPHEPKPGLAMAAPHKRHSISGANMRSYSALYKIMSPQGKKLTLPMFPRKKVIPSISAQRVSAGWAWETTSPLRVPTSTPVTESWQVERKRCQRGFQSWWSARQLFGCPIENSSIMITDDITEAFYSQLRFQWWCPGYWVFHLLGPIIYTS